MKLSKEEERVVTRIMDKDAVDNGLSIHHVIKAFRLGKQWALEKAARSHRRACKEWNRPSRI